MAKNTFDFSRHVPLEGAIDWQSVDFAKIMSVSAISLSSAFSQRKTKYRLENFYSDSLSSGGDFEYPWKLPVYNCIASWLDGFGDDSIYNEFVFTQSFLDYKSFLLSSLKDSVRSSLSNYVNFDVFKSVKLDWKVSLTGHSSICDVLNYAGKSEYWACDNANTVVIDDAECLICPPFIELELNDYSISIPISKETVLLAEKCVATYKSQIIEFSYEINRLVKKVVAKILRVALPIVVQLEIAIRILQEKYGEQLWPLLMAFKNN